MSIFKKILIPLAIVILLLAAYLVINGLEKRKEDNIPVETQETTKSIGRIIDFSSIEANKIIVNNNNKEEFVFTKKEEGEWEIISHPEVDLISSIVNSIAIGMSSVLPDKLIEEDASDLSVYGLDKPKAIIKVYTKDGKSYSLEIGSETPTAGGYYVKTMDNGNVYTIGVYTADRFFIEKNDLKVKTLFTFDEGVDVFSLTTEFSMEKNGEQFIISGKEGDDWYITYPINNIADLTSIGTIIQAITASTVNEFIEENPKDLSIYGLDVPSFSFNILVDNKRIMMHLGKDKEAGITKYAMIEGRNDVFTIDITTFVVLDKPLKEFIEVFAYIVNIDTATKIVINIDGETHVMGIKTNPDDKDLDEFTFDGKDSTMVNEDDKQPFRNLYQAIIGVTRSDIEIEGNPVGKAEISFSYTLNKEPGKMLIEFVSKDDWFYYLKRNGEYTGIIVEKIKFDEEEGVREMLKKMIEELEQ